MAIDFYTAENGRIGLLFVVCCLWLLTTNFLL
jgi:hypothetical protein